MEQGRSTSSTEKRNDVYNFPQRTPEQNNQDYLRSIVDYHKQYLGTPSIPGAISWFFFAVVFFVLYVIFWCMGAALCFTIILCICGIGFFLVGFIFLVLAVVCALIGLVFLLVAVLQNNPNANGANQNNNNNNTNNNQNV